MDVEGLGNQFQREKPANFEPSVDLFWVLNNVYEPCRLKYDIFNWTKKNILDYLARNCMQISRDYVNFLWYDWKIIKVNIEWFSLNLFISKDEVDKKMVEVNEQIKGKLASPNDVISLMQAIKNYLKKSRVLIDEKLENYDLKIDRPDVWLFLREIILQGEEKLWDCNYFLINKSCVENWNERVIIEKKYMLQAALCQFCFREDFPFSKGKLLIIVNGDSNQ